MTGPLPRTIEKRAKAQWLHELGMKNSEIAWILGITPEYVRILRGERGPTPVPRSAPFVSAALLFWHDGLSASEIGRHLGVTKNVIIGVAHRNDFPERPSPIIKRKRATDNQVSA